MRVARNLGALCGAVLLLMSPVVTASAEQTAEARAEALFREYVDLEAAFDTRVADLYSDTALIENKRTYPTGEVKVLRIPADKYKALIRSAMPLAREKNDRSTYSEVKYSTEGEHVRIKAVRYSELKKYSSPMSLLVGPGSGGKWLIYEELTESRP